MNDPQHPRVAGNQSTYRSLISTYGGNGLIACIFPYSPDSNHVLISSRKTSKRNKWEEHT
jgi:hypothetical protein